MQFRLHSQLVHLDLSNDGLLKMYNCLYCDIPNDGMIEKITILVQEREKLKLKLRGHLFRIKNNVLPSSLCTALVEYLPVFLKLEKLAHSTFTNTNWKMCYNKELRNIDLYYKILYREQLPASTVDRCFQLRNNHQLLQER